MKIPFLHREVVSNAEEHKHVFDSVQGCEPCRRMLSVPYLTHQMFRGTVLFCRCGAWKFFVKGVEDAQRSA
jgi:hypothetical protein